MYLTRKVEIHPGHRLYDWCHETTALANNLANAVRFRQRQVLTAVKKEPKDWTANEKEIMDEIANALPAMCIVGKKEKHYKLPTETKRFLNYSFLEDLLKVTKKPRLPGKRIAQAVCTAGHQNLRPGHEGFLCFHALIPKRPFQVYR